ncbi:MAG: hypothetical protein R3B90_12565 [Planctomycetaceae bacterium]
MTLIVFHASEGDTAGAALAAIPIVPGVLRKADDVVDAVKKKTPNPCTNSAFPVDPNDFTKQLGVPPSKVTTTKDGTVRIEWEPNTTTRIRYESHPQGLKPGDPGLNPLAHHVEHYHVEVKPAGLTWGRLKGVA